MHEHAAQSANKASLNSRPHPREVDRGDSQRVVKAGDGDLQVAIVGGGPVGLALALIEAEVATSTPEAEISKDWTSPLPGLMLSGTPTRKVTVTLPPGVRVAGSPVGCCKATV